MAQHVAAAAAMAAAVGLALTLQGCGPKPVNCSIDRADCRRTGCCLNKAHKCWMQTDTFASCSAKCNSFDQTKCIEVLPGGIMNTTTTSTTKAAGMQHRWFDGSWTTGYWDCCKPSCSWPGKGEQSTPINSCDGATDKVLTDANVLSVCEEGGTAATCSKNMPFKVSETLSMGFAAVAGKSTVFTQLNGDMNCGQCFEIVFTDKWHVDEKGNYWGGSSKNIVGKRMVIQVSNFGTDVTGNHSFDLLIPGAGQGIFAQGCRTQFPKFKKDDFDCGTRHGGCDTEAGCDKLPKSLQEGCRWRFSWYRWLKDEGKSNNPYIKFRRVKCPKQLRDISGVHLADDYQFPEVKQDDGTAEVVS